MQDIQKELESLRQQVAMLEELVALRAKVDELTRQLAPQVPMVPYVPYIPAPYIPPYVPAPAWPIYPSLPGRFVWAANTQTVTSLKEGTTSSEYSLDSNDMSVQYGVNVLGTAQ